MTLRGFAGESTVRGDRLTLQLAPALSPTGLVERPSFFHGLVAHPQVVARGLVVLADITATRYFQYTPESQRDPVLSAQGDRLRAECFSACNGVYARLDLLPDAFDTGEIGRGTTNVDVGPQLRRMLTHLTRGDLLHLDVGDDGLGAATPDEQVHQRPVRMPPRWVRALGSVAEIHSTMRPAFRLDTAAARRFLGSLPPVTATGRSGWLTPDRDGARLAVRPTAASVRVAGLSRWNALRRLLPHVTALTVYGPTPATADEVAAIEVELPGARLVVVITSEPWRGFSGEGSLLPALTAPREESDVLPVLDVLAFEPVVDSDVLARRAGTDPVTVRRALAVAAACGIVGWDAHEGAWYHRELPYDAERIDRDHPRLTKAHRLVGTGAVTPGEDGSFVVMSAGTSYQVVLGEHGDRVARLASATCTCAWFLRHRQSRGPCAHVLSADLLTEPA